MIAVYALGLFFVIEGLVYALAPDYVRMMLELLQKTKAWQQRAFGGCLVAFGLILILLARTATG